MMSNANDMPPQTTATSCLGRIQSLPAWLFAVGMTATPVALGLANLALLLSLLMAPLAGRWRERWSNLRQHPVFWAALTLYGVIVLGITYTDAPTSDWLLSLNKYLKVGAIGVWLPILMTEPRVRKLALWGFALAMTFVLGSTWANVWWVLPWSETQHTGWGVSHHVFGDYITQNVMMSFFVLLLLIAGQQTYGWRRWLCWSLVLPSIVSITHLSQGRTGLVLVATALLVFAVSMLRRKVAFIAVALVPLTLGLALATSSLMRDRVVQAIAEARQADTDPYSSIGHRLYNQRTTLAMIADAPLIGHGTGAYHTRICEYLDRAEDCHIFHWHPHNQYLFFGVNHGLVGVIAYLGLLAALCVTAWRSESTTWKSLLLGLTALLAVNSLFNSPLWSARESHFFTLMTALLSAQAWVSRRANAAHETI